MHKDDRFYTFLLTHSSKTKIYIRRVEASKNFAHSCAASLILFVGLVSLGVIGLFKTEGFYISKVNSQVQSNLTAFKPKASKPQSASITYDRLDPLEAMNNTGGPLTLSNVETEAEEQQLSARLRLIETTRNPAHVPAMWAHQGKIN